MAHIGADEHGVRARLVQLGDQARAGIVVATGHDQSCAFAGIGQGRGAGDAGQRAGNQNDRVIHVTSPSGRPHLRPVAGDDLGIAGHRE